MSTELPPHLRYTSAHRSPCAIVLADGEHYPPVVVDALAALRVAGWHPVCVALLGGSEKLRDGLDYAGLPVVRDGDSPESIAAAACDLFPSAAWALDLSDEPVLPFERRMRLVATLAARDVSYSGADSLIAAPRYTAVDVPSLAVVGTGKRIGKTAICAHVARIADQVLGGEQRVIVVAMGRGGPPDPVVIDRSRGVIGVERLLEISRAGAHAASDYLEDAALTGLTTVGCRRAGGGLLGVPVSSNVIDGARIAAACSPRLVLFEGSGSCIPPVQVDRTILIASTERPRDLFDDLGHYRLLRADCVLVVGDDAIVGNDMVARVESEYGIRAVAVRLNPTPVSDVAGRSVAAFTTAPEHVGERLVTNLRAAGAKLVLVSHNLARRNELRRDIARAVESGADTFVVEIKAAAIDSVAEAADEHGVDVVFLDNPPVTHDTSFDLDALLADQVRAVIG